MLQFTKTKYFRIAAAAALLIGVYAVAGFVVVPKVLRSVMVKNIPTALGVRPAVGDIRFNPFLFQLEVKDFSLSDPQGEKLVGFGRFFVDFEFSSIWQRAYSFANIDITSPYVNAIVSQDGRLNLLQLRPKPAPPDPNQKKDQPLPAVHVHSFKVSHGSVLYDDRSRHSAFAARLEPIDFELREFTTGSDGGRFTFSGASKLGERVEWHGHVSVQPIESDGEFQIDGLRAHTIWEYLADQLSFAVNSGSIDVNATYKFSLKDAVDLKVNVAKVAVTALTLRPKDADIDWVTVPELLVTGTSVDLSQRQAHVDSLSLTGLKLVTWMEPDGSINLLKLAAAPAPRGAVASANAASPAAGGATGVGTTDPVAGSVTPVSHVAGRAWQFELHKFELKEASISAEDRSMRPAVKVLLAPLSLQVEDASLDLTKPLTVALDTRINETGSLHASGTVTPQPAAADLGLKFGGIDLAAVQPYIAQHTSMTLLGGRLSGDTKIRYGANKPALQFTGNLSVANLHTVDNALHVDFVNWERLDVQGLNFQHDPDRLDIDQIVARKPYARVIIEPDTSLNVTRVLAGPGATVIVPAAPGSTAPAVTASAAQPPKALAPKVSKGAKAATAASSQSTASSGPPLMSVAIKKIALQAGQANFADLSVTPNFSTGIQSLQGTVLGLSSKANSRAKVEIHGAVDAFSPVAITGEFNVLGPALYTDIALSFRNMELTTFNPYSGKFAGYNITKGKLTTELQYKLQGRKLEAQHHISIDQLEFGDKTASKDAVSLPVKLAVALLKDRKGVIDLDIPVSGTLDDPKFRLGAIIWKVFINILEKAVTAPFALLGALFGGGPDLQFIDFPPGSATLDAAATDKVHAMVKGLSERPQLKVEVPIATVGELDRPALVDVQFKALLRDAQSAKTARKKSVIEPPEFDQLDPAAKVELLTSLYAKTVGGEPKYPEAVTNLKPKPEIAAAKADFLIQTVHEHIKIADTDLETLGQQRAAAVQQALLTGTQVDPARVFLVSNDKAKKQDGKVRLELSLK